jgi:hypothetical protein
MSDWLNKLHREAEQWGENALGLSCCLLSAKSVQSAEEFYRRLNE